MIEKLFGEKMYLRIS